MVSMSSAKPEPRALPKRFYKHVAFEPVDQGYCITLDGKRVRTPAKNLLQLMLQSHAAAIVAEWDAQTKVINTDAMPLTRLAHIALDLVPNARALLLEDIARYAETDLLCYRVPVIADDNPLTEDGSQLRHKQDAMFDPILAWAAREYGAAFVVTEGIIPVAQPAPAQAAIAAAYAAADDYALAALAMLVPLVGSALLALAIWKEQIAVEDALIAARLDEDVQAARWGQDMEAAAMWLPKQRDIRACAFFLTAK